MAAPSEELKQVCSCWRLSNLKKSSYGVKDKPQTLTSDTLHIIETHYSECVLWPRVSLCRLSCKITVSGQKDVTPKPQQMDSEQYTTLAFQLLVSRCCKTIAYVAKSGLLSTLS